MIGKSKKHSHHDHHARIVMIPHQEKNDEEEELIAEGEKRVFIVCSIPIICIAIISFFHIIVEHAPYFDGNCRQLNCVAGSNDQFIVWTLLFILLVIAILQFIFRKNTLLNPAEHRAQERVWPSIL